LRRARDRTRAGGLARRRLDRAGRANDDVPLSRGEVFRAGAGDVPGSGSTERADTRWPAADEAGQPVCAAAAVRAATTARSTAATTAGLMSFGQLARACIRIALRVHVGSMPEGHTIHRLARTQRKVLAGQPVAASSPQGRFAEGAARLDGRCLERIDPYGKHLFYSFEGLAEQLHVHLGLYGTFIGGPLPAPAPRGALRLRLVTEQVWSDLRGPTACELLTPAEVKAILARLGPDPLRPRADPDRAWERISRSRVAIGALLMDQTVVAGIGNVYRAELLFRAGISPFRPGRDITRAEWEGMWVDLQVCMRAGTRAGHIITTRPEDRSRRSRGVVPRDERFYVYRRHDLPCRLCGTPVRTDVMVGRNLFWCPVDQPR
jgi:endonuclease-8